MPTTMFVHQKRQQWSIRMQFYLGENKLRNSEMYKTAIQIFYFKGCLQNKEGTEQRNKNERDRAKQQEDPQYAK